MLSTLPSLLSFPLIHTCTFLLPSPTVAILSCSLSRCLSVTATATRTVMETEEDDQLHRPGSVPDPQGLSMSSSGSLSSLLATSSSGDISTTSGNFGEISALLLSESVAPILEGPTSSGENLEKVTMKEAVRPNKCIGKNNRGVSWGFTSVIGRRKEMEDAVAVFPGFMTRTCDNVGGCTASGSRTSVEISPIHFFGVYDGHGGSQVAKFCAKRMHEVIAEEWEIEEVNGYGWQRRWELALSNGFERTDNEAVIETVAADMVGSTAVVVVVSSCQIIVSNCGDSRAVLVRQTQTIPLTVDQKPDREDELQRIEEQGGKVINWMGARVLGVLAMSRAIGDRYLRPWIIPDPEITFTTRSDEDECVILASDGLWDVMSNEEVGEVARRLLRRRARSAMSNETCMAQVVADNLTDIAYGRNSSDNISIIVIHLKSRRTRPQRP